MGGVNSSVDVVVVSGGGEITLSLGGPVWDFYAHEDA